MPVCQEHTRIGSKCEWHVKDMLQSINFLTPLHPILIWHSTDLSSVWCPSNQVPLLFLDRACPLAGNNLRVQFRHEYIELDNEMQSDDESTLKYQSSVQTMDMSTLKLL